MGGILYEFFTCPEVTEKGLGNGEEVPPRFFVRGIFISCLTRLPDDGGWDFHAGAIESGESTVADKCDEFATCEEFGSILGGIDWSTYPVENGDWGFDKHGDNWDSAKAWAVEEAVELTPGGFVVSNVFRHVLRRKYSAEEYGHHVGRIDSGEIEAGAFFLEILLCDEFKALNIEPTPNNVVRCLMSIFINRDPTQEDLDHHGPRLGVEKIPCQVMGMEFYTCPEFTTQFEAAKEAAADWEPRGGWVWDGYGADWD